MVKISDFGMSREEEEYTVSDGLKQVDATCTLLVAAFLTDFFDKTCFLVIAYFICSSFNTDVFLVFAKNFLFEFSLEF